MAMNAAEGRRMLEASRKAPQPGRPARAGAAHARGRPHAQAAARRGLSWARCSRSSSRHGQGASSSRTRPLHWRQDIAERPQHPEHGHLVRGDDALARPGRAGHGDDQGRRAAPQGRERRLHDVRVPDHVDILANFGGGARRPPALQLGDRARRRRPRRGSSAPRARCGSRPTPRRLSGGRRGDKALPRSPIPAEQRIGWRVEEEFVNAIRGREKITRTTFEDGVRYMEFTDAVAKSAATSQPWTSRSCDEDTVKTVVALPGEGIGIEVVDATCELLTGTGLPLKILTPPQGSRLPGTPIRRAAAPRGRRRALRRRRVRPPRRWSPGSAGR